MHLASCGVNEPDGRMTQGGISQRVLRDSGAILLGIAFA